MTNGPKPGKNFAVSDGPVNRRLVAAPVLPMDDAAPIVIARIEAAKAKLRLGATLADRLSPLQQRPSNLFILYRVCGAQLVLRIFANQLLKLKAWILSISITRVNFYL